MSGPAGDRLIRVNMTDQSVRFDDYATQSRELGFLLVS